MFIEKNVSGLCKLRVLVKCLSKQNVSGLGFSGERKERSASD